MKLDGTFGFARFTREPQDSGRNIFGQTNWYQLLLCFLVLACAWGCDTPANSCRPPSVFYQGRCLPPCIENDVNYCAQPDGAIYDPADVQLIDVRVNADAMFDARDTVSMDRPDPCPMPEQLRCDGVCVDPRTSPNHCGACGTRCIGAPNAEGVCNAGRCEVGPCNMNFGDCDGNTMNGCETNLSSNTMHCVRCMNACTPMNAGALCLGSAGGCGFSMCNAGFGDCDTSTANGCESEFATSVLHCGACGAACPNIENGTARCLAGACGVGTCNAGFANCDDTAANGCEVALDTDIANCGRCSNRCPAPMMGTATCSMGMCGARCAVGYRLLNARCVADGVVPKQIAPASLGDVTRRQPALRWLLPPEFDGVLIELCSDRPCNNVIERLRSRGTSTRPTAVLAPNSVVFWRIRGTSGADDDSVVSPTWLFHVPARDAVAGVDSSFNPHLDLNGDGLDDVVVGASNASPGGRVNAGTVSVYHGNPMGMIAVPIRSIDGGAAGDGFGTVVAGAGDVNGDGFGDLLIGAPNADPGGRNNAGSLSLYLGGPTGIQAVAARVLDGAAPSDAFGRSAQGAGDVNGDGFGDVVVGAPNASPGGRNGAGTASIFMGSAAGLPIAAARILEGNTASDAFGTSVANAGDVNGDGLSDIIVGAEFASPGGRNSAGTVTVFHGSGVGIAMSARVLEGTDAGDSFGRSVASAGDVNGDGFSDVIIGSPFANVGAGARSGAARIFHGSANGLPMFANRAVGGVTAGDFFGFAVASAGDTNGDGYSDVIVGAPFGDAGGATFSGTASLFHGGMAGVPGVVARLIGSRIAGDGFGRAVGNAGDVNGDGFADVVVGVPFADPVGRMNAGIVQLHLGSAMGIGLVPVSTVNGPVAADYFGISVAIASPRRAWDGRRWSLFIAFRPLDVALA